MHDPPLRASDADREQTVAELREHLLAGRLTLEEFSDRVGAAYQARTGNELVPLAADLPAVPAPAPSRRPMRLTAGMFAHIVRRGRLRLHKRTFALSVLTDLDLDLREARIDSQVTTVWVLALFGNVDVYVPERVDAEVGGVTIVGHRREWGLDASAHDAPTVRVRAFGVFGTVDVWRVPADAQGDYRAVIKAIRAG